MASRNYGVFSQKELIKICVDRINTQDRDGRLPMRVINKILNNSSNQKKWKDTKEEYKPLTIQKFDELVNKMIQFR